MKLTCLGMRHLFGPSLLAMQMVVDTDPATGAGQLRYLVYDIVALNGHPIGERPFDERRADHTTSAPAHIQRALIARLMDCAAPLLLFPRGSPWQRFPKFGAGGVLLPAR